MVKEAIKKINDEIEKEDNSYVQVIGKFLLEKLESNPAVAEKILTEDKTIMKSLNAMKKEAEKNRVGNCAVLTDQEGFKIVLNYFDIDDTINHKKKKENVNFDVKLDDLL